MSPILWMRRAHLATRRSRLHLQFRSPPLRHHPRLLVPLHFQLLSATSALPRVALPSQVLEQAHQRRKTKRVSERDLFRIAILFHQQYPLLRVLPPTQRLPRLQPPWPNPILWHRLDRNHLNYRLQRRSEVRLPEDFHRLHLLYLNRRPHLRHQKHHKCHQLLLSCSTG